MATRTITLELPVQTYKDLQALAQAEQKATDEIVAELVHAARQQIAWSNALSDLLQSIAQNGGLRVSGSRSEVVARLRRTREEIFEAEYAHLY